MYTSMLMLCKIAKRADNRSYIIFECIAQMKGVQYVLIHAEVVSFVFEDFHKYGETSKRAVD